MIIKSHRIVGLSISPQCSELQCGNNSPIVHRFANIWQKMLRQSPNHPEWNTMQVSKHKESKIILTNNYKGSINTSLDSKMYSLELLQSLDSVIY